MPNCAGSCKCGLYLKILRERLKKDNSSLLLNCTGQEFETAVKERSKTREELQLGRFDTAGWTDPLV